jgi:hypothetical protein
MAVLRCSQNLWISLLKTIPQPIATPSNVKTFLALPIFFAQFKPLYFNDLRNPLENCDTALQRRCECKENVHKSSPLLHANHPSRTRAHGGFAARHPAKPPQMRLFDKGVRKPLAQAIPWHGGLVRLMPMACPVPCFGTRQR